MQYGNAKEKEESVSFMLLEIEENMSERDFQRDFYESLNEQFEQRRSLSDKQIAALTKMHERVTDVRPCFGGGRCI